MKLILSFLFAFLFLTASAQSTHRQYLSGEGESHGDMGLLLFRWE